MSSAPFYLTEAHARKRGALGKEPLPDARYLIAPIDLPPVENKEAVSPSGVHGATVLFANIQRNNPLAFTSEEIAFVWVVWAEWHAKTALGFPKLWVQTRQARNEATSDWMLFEAASPDAKVMGFALGWELNTVLSDGVTNTARELTKYVAEAARRVAPRGWSLSLNLTAEEASQRAKKLVALKVRFSRSVEMRLVPQSKPFFAQAVWRCAYALGMEWNDTYGSRFLWRGGEPLRPLFFLGTGEAHGLLLPQLATGSETVPGLVFYFELPTAPAPIETFDRMALALNYFAQTLGGRPVTATGDELDGDRLETMRDELVETVSEMTQLGIAPGSPEAARFF